MNHDMFDIEYHNVRALTPDEEALLKGKLRELPAFIADAPFVIEELAQVSEVANPSEAAKDLDYLLPVLDAFWKQEDFDAYPQQDWVWVGARIMYFIGEWLIHRCGGSWLVPEDPESDVFATYAIGSFTQSLPPEAIVDPAATMSNYMHQPPGRSLISELERLWRDALGLDRGMNRISQLPDQLEHARLAVIEQREQGSTDKRCVRCGSAFTCVEDREYSSVSYTIRCESGCYSMTIYDLQKPLAAPTKVTFVSGDTEV